MDINCPKEGAFSSAMPIPLQKRTALEINKQPITAEAAARNFQLIPFLICGTASGCSIKVTSPDGDEDWEPGTTQSITWSSVNLTGNVKIELWKDGSFDSTLSADESDDSIYSWDISSELADGSDYKIRITSLVDETVYDESDANFTLASPVASITVTDPDGSEDWETGSTHNITWTSANLTGNVKIELYKGGSLDSTLSADEANDDSYSWAISAGLADGTDYKIRITSLVDGSVYDESDANFSLAAPTSITVTAPNGSESWDLDSTESITWSDVNLTGNVKIELYKDGSLDSVLSADEANTGSYSWAISDSLTAAADYKIRITSLADGTVYDESDANFTLASAASITVDVPNGGEDWIAGVEQTVEWSSTGVTGNVNIKLYDENGFTLVWTWNTANDGEFSFTPDIYRVGDQMQIRIGSNDDETIYDFSDADFTIALPTSVTVVAPNGGEEWEPDTTESITWSSVNLTGNVKIELYKDGTLDSTLTSDTANTGSYSWAIDSELTEADDYKIRITSLVDGTVYDESDANFELAAASDYDPPAVSSGLIVKLDAGDPNSFDSGDDEVWTNTVDSVEGDFLNGPVFDDTDSIKSMYFDGSDDAFHLVRDNSDLDSGEFTLVSWFMPVDQFTNGSNSYAYVWNFGYPDPGFGWIIYGKMIALGWGTSGYATYSGGGTIALDEWHMAAFVSDGAGTIDSFLNNVKAGSPVPDDFDTDAPSDDFWFPRLGSYAGAGYNSEMKIAQFLIYDRALSDAEIEDLWDGDKERFGLS